MMKRIASVIAAAVMLAAETAYLPQNALQTQAAFKKHGDFEYTVSDGKVTITGCDMDITQAIIPSSIEGYPVTEIGNSVFMYCKELTTVTIPDSVVKIGSNVFVDCVALKEINIPESLTDIGDSCFDGSAWLQEKRKEKKPVIINHNLIDWNSAAGDVTVPIRVTRICGPAFMNCTELTSVTVQEGVKDIGIDTFSGCTALESVWLPDSLEYIHSSAFENCTSLESIKIPKTVRGIFSNTFKGCTNLKNVTFSDYVWSIGNGAFSGCSKLQIFDLPKYVRKIEANAFRDCTKLLDAEFPDGLEEIEPFAYSGCSMILAVDIPESVEKVGKSAFADCKSLRAITFRNPECVISEAAFFNELGEDGIQHEYAGTVFGYAGSTAQAYAEEYGYKFSEIGQKGDVNGDSWVSASDAQKALNAFLNTINGDASGLTDLQFAAADADGNQKLTALDAQYILTYYLYNNVLDEQVEWDDIIQ